MCATVRRGSSLRLVCLFCVIVALLLCACRPGNDINKLPDLLAKKQADLTSYRLSLLLEQTDGQQLTIQQWYQAPDCVRTDINQAGAVSYQFFLQSDKLTVRHVDTGKEEQLRLTSDNALFTTPLLHELLYQAKAASWRQSDERPHSYFAEFPWRDRGGEPKLGSMWLNANSLLPEEVTLFFGAKKVLHLIFTDIALNPKLEEQIFQP